MSTLDASPWAGGAWRWFATPDRRLLLLSIALQLALAVPFGHSYDTRLFMATGYLVGTGQNPYVAQDLSAVFDRASFALRSTVGYLPPWPLVLGLLYLGVHAVVPSLLVYNLALKLPVIAATVGLAYLVAAALQNLGAPPTTCRRAWVFLLFNPLLLYFGAAWGQIDAIVALLSLSALLLVWAGRSRSSAVVLALAVCFKPIALPLVLVALVFVARESLRRAIGYAAVFAGGALLFCVTPFVVLGWSPSPILDRWNAHFTMSGTLSYMTVLRLVRDPFQLTGHWWLLGLVWIPALAICTLALRRGDGGFADLLKKSTAVVLVFYLTRTWLSESNLILILPLVLILTSMGELDRRALSVIWILPLVFTVVGSTPLQLLFPAFPEAMDEALDYAARWYDVALLVRAALVISWQVAGWWIVVACFRRDPARVPLGENAAQAVAR